jgi:hypothetical protein
MCNDVSKKNHKTSAMDYLSFVRKVIVVYAEIIVLLDWEIKLKSCIVYYFDE